MESLAMIDEPMPTVSDALSLLRTFGLTLILAGVLVLAGCDSTDVSDPDNQLTDVIIAPDSVSIAVGEQVDFSARFLTASGDTVQHPDVTLYSDWTSTNTTVFTVADNGLATGREPGMAYCRIEVSDEAAGKVNEIQRFVGRDSAFVFVF